MFDGTSAIRNVFLSLTKIIRQQSVDTGRRRAMKNESYCGNRPSTSNDNIKIDNRSNNDTLSSANKVSH